MHAGRHVHAAARVLPLFSLPILLGMAASDILDGLPGYEARIKGTCTMGVEAVGSGHVRAAPIKIQTDNRKHHAKAHQAGVSLTACCGMGTNGIGLACYELLCESSTERKREKCRGLLPSCELCCSGGAGSAASMHALLQVTSCLTQAPLTPPSVSSLGAARSLLLPLGCRLGDLDGSAAAGCLQPRINDTHMTAMILRDQCKQSNAKPASLVTPAAASSRRSPLPTSQHARTATLSSEASAFLDTMW